MNTTHTIRTIAGAAIAAGAMLFMTMPGGAVHAEGRMSTSNNIKQLGLAVHSYEGDGHTAPGDLLLHRWQAGGDTDGRDFLIWQRNPASAQEFDCSELVQWASSSAPAADSGDYEVWRDNFGRTGAASAGHEVGHLLGLGSTR